MKRSDPFRDSEKNGAAECVPAREDKSSTKFGLLPRKGNRSKWHSTQIFFNTYLTIFIHTAFTKCLRLVRNTYSKWLTHRFRHFSSSAKGVLALLLNSLRLVSWIRHHWSQYSTRQTLKSLWHFWHCSIVVSVLFYWKDSNGDHRQQQLNTIHSLLWRAAPICPRSCFIHVVNKTTVKFDRTSLNLQSIFCWWHSTSWFLPSSPFGHHCPTYAELHFWSQIVDGLQ